MKSTKHASPNRSEVIHLIQTLLRNNTLETQEDLQQLLAKRGIKTNQVKISRILHKLGAIKVNENGKLVYRLPLESLTLSPRHSLNQLVLKIEKNEVLIIIHTTPGSAQLVAAFLDQIKQDANILGTVAGDNTIFVATKSTKDLNSTIKKIREALF